MPPDERRSPASRSTSTRTRSCSILMGVLSAVTAGTTGSLDDLAEDAEDDDHADHAANGLEDVVGARLTGLQVDEVGLHRRDLPIDDRLRVRSVDQLVDGPGES